MIDIVQQGDNRWMKQDSKPFNSARFGSMSTHYSSAKELCRMISTVGSDIRSKSKGGKRPIADTHSHRDPPSQ